MLINVLSNAEFVRPIARALCWGYFHKHDTTLPRVLRKQFCEQDIRCAKGLAKRRRREEFCRWCIQWFDL